MKDKKNPDTQTRCPHCGNNAICAPGTHDGITLIKDKEK